MSENIGAFCWYDLMTTNLEAATVFYKAVIGWDIKDSGMPDRTYSILSIGETMVGGMMPMPGDAKAADGQPRWTGYISVPNVDEWGERVKSAGGSLCHKPEDIPGVGRFAVAADPDGAIFILFTGMGGQPAAPDMRPGHIGWHELHAGDLEPAFGFYAKLFGWTKDQAMDMGPMGKYQLFKTGHETPVGGMMKRCDGPARWLYYFSIKGIDAAAGRVKQGGGKVLHGPEQVPGDAWIIKCVDPQGAAFALVGSK